MMNILVFHAVSDGAWFESVISWLKSKWRLVPIESVAAYYANGEEHGKSCHITTDDGDESFADVMFPILRKHSVHSSLFVSPKMSLTGGNFWFQEIEGFDTSELIRTIASVLKCRRQLLSGVSPEAILKTMSLREIEEVISRCRHDGGGRDKVCRNLSVDTLQEIVATGLVSVGAHTLNHPILANEDDATCQMEIAGSVCGLTSLMGRPVELFAYPNGVAGLDFGGREEGVLRECGIKMAFTTESRNLSRGDNAMRVPRVAVSNGESTSRLRAKMFLGQRWSRLRRIAGIDEGVKRERLSRTLKGARCME